MIDGLLFKTKKASDYEIIERSKNFIFISLKL